MTVIIIGSGNDPAVRYHAERLAAEGLRVAIVASLADLHEKKSAAASLARLEDLAREKAAHIITQVSLHNLAPIAITHNYNKYAGRRHNAPAQADIRHRNKRIGKKPCLPKTARP